MIGALLAGGAGRRLGLASKAAAPLAGRALLEWPLAALAPVCVRVAVVCKPGAELPELTAVERWEEPPEPRHPLTGIVHALERAAEPVLICAADMPFVTSDACRSLIEASHRAGERPVVAAAEGRLQPVLGLYSPTVLPTLRAAPPDTPLTRTVEALDPLRVALPPALVRSVNTPEDLAAAEALLLER